MTIAKDYIDHGPNQAPSALELRPVQPGHLMSALRWAARPLLELLLRYPELAPAVLQLDCRRMHLIALAFANTAPICDEKDAETLICGSFKGALAHVFAVHPPGARRALGQLSSRMMSAEAYRRLMDLLNSPDAKLIHHADGLNENKINLFYAFPAASPSAAGAFKALEELRDAV